MAAVAEAPPLPPVRGRSPGGTAARRGGRPERRLPGDGDAAAMEAAGLPAALELAAGGGAGLSPEKRAALGASLPLLRRDYRFEAVWFWGCVRGVRGAYYIAQGLGTDRAAPRSRLYRCPGDGERERDGRPHPNKRCGGKRGAQGSGERPEG